jgi:23S rRNA (uridine2552-2'-O)-methyltransferase
MSTYSKPDFWALKAQKEGYPARSVYKLEEIDEKFKLMKPGVRILDLGAAPGSWSLWTLKKLKGTGFVAACDLEALAKPLPFPNFFFLKGDLYDEKVRTALRDRGPFNIVMSDAAPLTSGNKMVDTGRSFALVEAVMDYAGEMLKPGGSMIAKVFQGGEEGELISRMKTMFAAVHSFKPKACRRESFETYLIGIGLKQA